MWDAMVLPRSFNTVAIMITSGKCRCRYTGILEDLEQGATYLALASHFLCYFNSAINPVIYSFMSGTSLTHCVNPVIYSFMSGTSLTRSSTAS